MRAVSTSHRLVSPTEVSPVTSSARTAPRARRVGTDRWRDPRLWLGLLLVCGSVAVGAKLLAAADETVAVWQLTASARAGTPISADGLRTTRVHFDDAAAVSAYWPTSQPLPENARLLRDVSQGELLSSAAVTGSDVFSLRQMPLAVSSSGFPTSLSVGDHVDVWAVPQEEGAEDPSRVLADATVTALGDGSSVGSGGDREVVVSLPSDTAVAEALGSLNGATVVLIVIGV